MTEDREKRLAPLALWMHRTSPGVGLVREGDLDRELERIYAERGNPDPERAARNFLEDVRQHTGLLLDRGGRQYGFIHLTFQEYLAAVALGQKGQRGVEPVVEALREHVGENTWHEVSLLAVAYLGIVQQRDEAAGQVLEGLLPWGAGGSGQSVVLAGEALADVGMSGVTPASAVCVLDALVEILGDTDRVGSEVRVQAGRLLAQCGDPRSEVMTIDGMQFCYVPPGPFRMGSADEDDMAFGNETSLNDQRMDYGYWLGRYSVTVAQFRAHVEESGSRPGDTRALRDDPNRPVRYVSWHEALAFCDWLTERLRKKAVLPAHFRAILPSETEWEKAARGGLEIPGERAIATLGRDAVPVDLVANPDPNRRYPWGDAPDPERGNYYDSRVGDTSAVGVFAGGASPYGCEDMSGNLQEWTRSLYGDYPYPDNADARRKREDLKDSGRRVLRGGAFFDLDYSLRCACRNRIEPELRNYGIGFRVVLSPFL